MISVFHKKYLQEEEFNCLEKTPLSTSPRIWAFLSFIYYGNIHPKDLESLTFEMIDTIKGIITIKSDYERGMTLVLSINKELKIIIENLYSTRKNSKQFVFGENFESSDKPLQLKESKALNEMVMKILLSLGDRNSYAKKNN